MSVAPPRIVIDNTYGAGFIGAIVTAMLYGITTLQTWFYFVHYPKDSSENKLLVSMIWVLDTAHMALVSLCMYHYLVTNYANPPALGIGHWSLFMSVALNVVIAFVVQIFFTFRIFRLSSAKIRWWITGIISLAILAHFCFGIETVVFLFIKKELKKLPEITLFAAMPFALVAVLSDIFIALALCILLHGSRTGFRRTNAVVTTLMIYAINRCLLTSVVAVAEVIVFAIAPDSLWFLAIDFVIGKLYANSLLATLNSRQSIRVGVGSSVNTVHLSDIDFEGSGNNSTVPKVDSRGHILDLRSEAASCSSVSRSNRTLDEEDKAKSKLHQTPPSDFLSMSMS
ncbi:hypothetical protein BDQ12DRAFT_216821 [Crucibulum laeve]|uniref:DUF6534 domain-containing protein n=1 Tax=Crucibulum laeve TaxID=68775 RepID=A0A5C3LVQ3_9AGAR|nr:hypothetical protein BDQ12DRAFT_216821 [Crucibulum laeve]